MLTILSMCAVVSAEVRNFRELMFDKRYDMTSVSSYKRVYGSVQSASLLRITIQTKGKAPEILSYPTHRRLSQGMYSYRANDPIAYTVHDIRPGDEIDLYLCLQDKTLYCYAISPGRRPGGRVPESRNPHFFRSYGEQANAVNAFNDTGRPVPRHLEAGVRASEYPFADPDVPKAKWLKRFPKEYPFSYVEYILFMR